MAATFPGGVKTFSTKQAGDQIASAHINDLQAEVVAIETTLGANPFTWTAYTPTWTAVTTNPSIGNGTKVGRYVQIGKTVICVVSLTMGSTTTYGSGNWSFSPPKTAANNGVRYLGKWNAYDVGADKSYVGNCEIWAGASNVGTFARDLSAGWLDSSTPFTWGSGDELRFQLVYEAE